MGKRCSDGWRGEGLVLFLLGLGTLAVGPGRAAPVPAPAAAKLPSVTYDVADLLYRPGGKSGYDSIDDIIKAIVTTVDPEAWGPRSDESIEDVDGTRLEVRTTAARHTEIKTLLAALRRNLDVNVVLSAELWEIDRASLAKEIAPYDKRIAIPVDDKMVAKLRKAASRATSRVSILGNGRKGLVFARRRPFTYVADRVGGAKGKAVHGTGFQGLTLHTSVQVSPDRRFVRLRIVRRRTELAQLDRGIKVDRDTGDPYPVEVPDLVETSTTAKLTVGDSVALVLPLPPLPGPALAKGKTRVLLVRPVIRIEEEERAKPTPGS